MKTLRKFIPVNGYKVESRSEEIIAGDFVITRTIKNDSGTIASQVRTTSHGFAWGKEVIETVTDPTGIALTTTMTYYEDPTLTGSYTRIKTRTNPDGSWITYEYDETGRTIVEITSWLDAPAETAAASAQATYYDYTPDPDDSTLQDDRDQPRIVTGTILGTTVSKTYYSYRIDEDNNRIEIEERAIDPTSSFGDPANQRTVRTYHPSGTALYESGRIKTTEYPDGRLDTYTYEKGTYDPATTPGVFTPGPGNDTRESVAQGTIDC